MNQAKWLALAVTALVTALAGLPVEVKGEAVSYYRITIQNNTGQAANDLRLAFVNQEDFGTLGRVKLRPRRDYPNPDPSGTIDPNANYLVTFAPNTFGIVDSGKSVNIDYCTTTTDAKPLPQSLVPENSRWTADGQILGRVTAVGRRMLITKLASLDLYNPESSPLEYTNVAVYAGNDLSNFNIDDFVTPTGSLVSGVPSNFVLNPGDSVSFPLGTLDPAQGYMLALGQVAFTSDPGNVFDLAATSAVPEPATCVLAATGAAIIVSFTRRRKDRKHQGT